MNLKNSKHIHDIFDVKYFMPNVDNFGNTIHCHIKINKTYFFPNKSKKVLILDTIGYQVSRT